MYILIGVIVIYFLSAFILSLLDIDLIGMTLGLLAKIMIGGGSI